MHQSMLQSAAATGQPVRLKMFDNTEVRGVITALDRDGLILLDTGRVINRGLVREVLITDTAHQQILSDGQTLNHLTTSPQEHPHA